ncbi:MAG: 2-C-methyl-D-erythritol 4-phosphate cytidylyltransferase [Thermoguttaceae bacterium]
MKPTFAAILLAAGAGTRFGGNETEPRKPFVVLNDKPMWMYSAERFVSRSDVVQTIVVVPADLAEKFRTDFADTILAWRLDVVTGGRERYDSVTNALRAVRDNATMVAIHDTARPCVTGRAIDSVFAAAAAHRAAILASPLVGTLKRSSQIASTIEATVPRENLWEAHTPQVFERRLIDEAYQKRGDFTPTDDSQLVERLGVAVHLVESERTNIKVTTRDDLALAASVLKETIR